MGMAVLTSRAMAQATLTLITDFTSAALAPGRRYATDVAHAEAGTAGDEHKDAAGADAGAGTGAADAPPDAGSSPDELLGIGVLWDVLMGSGEYPPLDAELAKPVEEALVKLLATPACQPYREQVLLRCLCDLGSNCDGDEEATATRLTLVPQKLRLGRAIINTIPVEPHMASTGACRGLRCSRVARWLGS